ncbi:hypothetical protein [Streptomyces achromogenes]|uniref:hypothetical protein n=1 Tax=Streptomyces achromogenes TaxID=67255 RepID=UPI0036F5A4A5
MPEHELIVPVKSKYGLAFAVRPGAGMEQAMLDELNRTADWVLGIGLAHLESQEAETAPEREE